MLQVISVLLENKPGALMRVTGLLTQRGYNIESLTVARTLDPELSRMTIAVDVDDNIRPQVIKQMNKLINVLQATDLTNPDGIQVESVGSGSPVARAGVADNDVITTLDGRSVATVGELIEWLSTARPGQVMSISWLDDDHRHSAVVTLGNQPASAVQS